MSSSHLTMNSCRINELNKKRGVEMNLCCHQQYIQLNFKWWRELISIINSRVYSGCAAADAVRILDGQSIEMCTTSSLDISNYTMTSSFSSTCTRHQVDERHWRLRGVTYLSAYRVNPIITERSYIEPRVVQRELLLFGWRGRHRSLM